MDPGAKFDGNPLGTECLSGAGSNAGCAIRDFDGTAGAPFNAGGGGVVAVLWDDSQITFWRFARGEIPQDVRNGLPNPDGWGTPIAHWADESCDIENAFRDMQSPSPPFLPCESEIENCVPVVINITICGDWAGSVFAADGFSGSCGDAVADPSNYDGAIIVPF
jgi:hypothetical protein